MGANGRRNTLISCSAGNLGGVLKAPRRLFLRLAGAAAALTAVSRLARAQADPPHSVFVVFALPVGSLARIRAGLSDGNIEVTAQVPNRKDLAVGRLSIIGNQVDPASGTIRFRANFDNTNEALSTGQSVDVSILGYRALGEVLNIGSQR
jgi:multidrug efflux system membrane fusion protein